MNTGERKLYPMLFSPIYREIMWGGDLMRTHLDRDIPETEVPVAESWELSDRPDAVSVVENGPLAGATIADLLKSDGANLMGRTHAPGKPFPLLVKLIDAGKRLSLQVHPDAAACAELEGAEPKTEMWYVMAAKPEGRIFAGLKQSCTKQKFLESLKSNDVENCLQSFQSAVGDAYFISAGTAHAIGAGNLLLEIQQNSNTTYRISDWGRLGPDGKPRELHVEEALRCVNFVDRSLPRIPADSSPIVRNRKIPLVNRCPFFGVSALRLVEEWMESTESSVPHLITAIDAPVTIGKGSESVLVERGRTCLVPADYGIYRISPVGDAPCTVVRTTLN